MASKTPLFDLTQPLTTDQLVSYEEELRLLQGNILKSHGRESSINIFLTFKPNRQADVKRFLREFVGRITSAAEQARQTLRFKEPGRKTTEELFAGLYLSARGYDSLGFSPASFAKEFREGMQAAGARLDDPPVSQWDEKFQKVIHAMIVLAHDHVPQLTKELCLLRAQIRDIAEVSSEFGLVIKNESGRVIEHFGYVDGISQPLFFADEIKGQSRTKWDPSAGPKLVLVKDPLGNTDAECGTYYVFRKLEQNVRGFKKREQALGDALKLTGEARELAGAMVIGRFEDGTPVVLNKRAGGAATENDFTYPSADAEGNRCPFAAHIRKTNPRGDSMKRGTDLDQEKARRIVRRGITYGDPTPPGEDFDALPEEGVGLLFQCCQANLAEQFEVIQQRWANDDGFVQTGTGRDPVVGQSRQQPFPEIRYPNPWDSAGRTTFDFHGFVTLRGGEYFFAPSIGFLKRL